jgi:hypothetical protein
MLHRLNVLYKTFHNRSIMYIPDIIEIHRSRLHYNVNMIYKENVISYPKTARRTSDTNVFVPRHSCSDSGTVSSLPSLSSGLRELEGGTDAREVEFETDSSDELERP